MKHLKSFEKVETYKDFIVGEYVLLNLTDHFLLHKGFSAEHHKQFLEYINSTIGVVSTILKTNQIIITYDNIPSGAKRFFNYDSYNKYHMLSHASTIEYHSSNRNDVESHMVAKKYNI